MLYLFHGSNTHLVSQKAQALVAGLLKKRPDAGVFSFDATSSLSDVEALLEAQGLFAEKHIMLLKGVLEEEKGREAVLARASAFASSPHIVVLVEGVLDTATLRALKEHAHDTQEYKQEKKGAPAFNVFALSDALTARDKKSLWAGLIQARLAGTETENVVGTLLWGLRALLLAVHYATPEEANMKVYPFEKAKKGVCNFSEEELRSLSRSLIALYHEAHRGGQELDEALERWVLARL